MQNLYIRDIAVSFAMMFVVMTSAFAKTQALDNLPKPTALVNAKVGKTFQESTPGTVTIPKVSPGAPNIAIFLIDDMRFGALSTFGGPIPSPAIERLAQRGITYNDFSTRQRCAARRVPHS